MNPEYIRELERSHDELRGALIFAGRRVPKLTFGKLIDDRHLAKLREVLVNARTVRRKTRIPSPTK